MTEPEPYRSPFEQRPNEPVDERALPPWMRREAGESGPERTARCFHSCYICGEYIADLAALDAHEEDHSVSEKAAALCNRQVTG